MAFKVLDSVDWKDPLAQALLFGRIPNIGSIPSDLRGGRTKGDAMRYAVLIRNYMALNAKEVQAERDRMSRTAAPMLSNQESRELVGVA